VTSGVISPTTKRKAGYGKELPKSRYTVYINFMQKTFTAIVHKEGVWYVAECPEVGTASQGSTIENAIENLREATEVYLEEFPLKAILFT
jgi:predicted RNase H-like HicB family nuclease